MSKETIEEAAFKWIIEWDEHDNELSFIKGANWQSDRMYSEEQVLELLHKVMRKYSKYAQHFGEYVDTDAEIKMYLEQLKKK